MMLHTPFRTPFLDRFHPHPLAGHETAILHRSELSPARVSCAVSPEVRLLSDKVNEWWAFIFLIYKLTVGFAVVEVIIE